MGVLCGWVKVEMNGFQPQWVKPHSQQHLPQGTVEQAHGHGSSEGTRSTWKGSADRPSYLEFRVNCESRPHPGLGGNVCNPRVVWKGSLPLGSLHFPEIWSAVSPWAGSRAEHVVRSTGQSELGASTDHLSRKLAPSSPGDLTRLSCLMGPGSLYDSVASSPNLKKP